MSVIIPVRDGGARLSEVLKACSMQTYQGKWEIIVVDNGSVDSTKRIAEGFPDVNFQEERSIIGSPYSARNRGIEAASGQIIALLDATCVPKPHWLTQGISAMQRIDRGLVAGEVAFRIEREPPSAGEIWDSVVNVRQDLSVARGVAKTGNLFIHSDVLVAQGPFREGVRSGEDVRWTGAASEAGWPLVYAEDAVVEIKARGGLALLKKFARTGSGKASLLSAPHRLLKGVALFVVPPSPRWVLRLLRERSPVPINTITLVRVWLFAWCGRIAHGFGHLFPSLRRIG